VDSAAIKLEAEIQNEIALQTQQQQFQKLINLSHLIFVRSAPLCEKKKPALGILVGNHFIFREGMRNAAKKVFGVSDNLSIMIMAADSSAAKAGLLPGDELLSINGITLPGDKNAQKQYKKILSELGDNKKLHAPINLRIKRDKTEKLVPVTPDISCDYGYGLVSDDQINAFADGNNVFVTTGMLRFVNDDNELALVISHELAHNVMQHMSKKKQNYMLGSIFDIIAAGYGVNTQGVFGNIGAQRYSQEFEAEADYVGLYMMALSGLPIDNSHYFWRRMAAANPGGIKQNHASSHPSTPERFLSLEKTVGEIKHKTSSNLPLKPDLQQD
jgi:predicted Zn-dependent protease